ncbi:MAG: RHS repeat-associated core domain-containing protein [Candidatus Vecturithrix sp.]|nr:RHS repeat-associated core domain-containing protein [Candidatus Vecturithrix sp.]
MNPSTTNDDAYRLTSRSETSTYDAANRMIHAEDGAGSITADYLYDPFGRRLRKEVDKNGIVTTTYFLYADEGLIGEFSESGTPLRVYGYLPGTSTPFFLRQNDTYYWYRTDRLGVPHTLMETNGHVVWSGTYDAFGNCEVGVETVESHLRLPGQYYDAETGLSYNLNRYYDPKIGRYLQPDPAGDGLNPYIYVGSNPVNAVDPLGLCAVRMFSGMTETLVGYGFVTSGVFLVPGTLMMINGMDEAVAGLWGLWTGQPSRSVLEHAMYSTIPNETVASSVHFASQLAISAGPGIAAMRAGWKAGAPHRAWKKHINTVIDDIDAAGRPRTMVLGEGGQGTIRSFVNRDPRRMTEFLEMRPLSLDYQAFVDAGTFTQAMSDETLDFNLMLIRHLHKRGFSFKVLKIARSADATSDWLRAELKVLEGLGVSWDIIPQSHIDNVMKLKKWR